MSHHQTPMRFDDQFLADLKARLPPSVVIGRTVKLQRRGQEYVGLSPFSKERTPSFCVNDDKGFFHCFSSGKHGDVIAFVQETERLSFPEAVRRLAADAGMSLPAVSARAARRDERLVVLAGWLERAAAWFEAVLHGPAGGAARAYLHHRGLGEAEWRRFRLGYAPGDRAGLRAHLAGQGASVGDLIEAGLLIEPGSGGAAHDRFRDRIIFPIVDAQGRVASFGGRALGAGARAKYLNGPETRLFSKGRVLFGLPEARKLLHLGERDGGADASPPIAVEGYLDVIACQRAGLPAVAPMGTALTEDQMEALWRLHPEPILAFDPDPAGRRAVARAIDRVLPLLGPERSFRFASLPDGLDPDDLFRERGAPALRRAFAGAQSFSEALFAQARDLEPLDTPERRAGLRARLRAAVARIADEDLARAYEATFETWLSRLEAASLPGFAAALALAALDRPAWARAFPIRMRRVGFGDSRLEPAASAVLEALAEGGGARERLVARGGGDLIARLETTAAAVAAPFLDPHLDPGRALSLWRAGYEALIELNDDKAGSDVPAS